MEKCVFLKMYTTGNDLYGKHNCPIRFEFRIYDKSTIYENPLMEKVINIEPDEDIMPTGYISVRNTEYSDLENKLDIHTALEKIYAILTAFKDKGFYIAGYSHENFDLKILNEHFKRILNKDPIIYDKNKIIDIMKLAEVLIPVGVIGCYSLNSVYSKLFGVSTVYEKTDLEKIYLSFSKMMTDARINFEKSSFEFLQNFIENGEKGWTFNFGKYKGMDVDWVFENDKEYCSWLLKSKNMIESQPKIIENIKNLMNKVE